MTRIERVGDSQELPVQGKQEVITQVIDDIHKVAEFRHTPTNVITRLQERIQQRRELGIVRYGRPLETYNGRDFLVDAFEELLDAQNYLKQGCMQSPRDSRFRNWYWIVQGVVLDMATEMYGQMRG